MNRRRDTRVQPRIRQSFGVSNMSTPKLTDKTKASPSLKGQPTFSKKTFSGGQSGPSMRVGGAKDEAWYRSFILEQREKGPTEFKTRFFLFALGMMSRSSVKTTGMASWQGLDRNCVHRCVCILTDQIERKTIW